MSMCSFGSILKLAVPMILAMTGQTLMHFLDGVFLAQYSDAAIAAAGPAGMSSWLLISLFNGAAGFANDFTHSTRAPADQTISALPSGKAYTGIVTGLIIALFGTFSATRYSL